MTPFESFFLRLTKHSPHLYQIELAGASVQDCLIRVPTGCGKTAGAICAWLWRLLIDRERTPTRLVYCLPMRVLVEQTRALAEQWVQRSQIEMSVYTLMGGEIDEDWEFDPDRPAILVGTQEQLLSRALNRGYAMSRYRWPVHFGLLNSDCLWVCDEVQLMGNGLATTAQLQALRQTWGTYGPVATWWMSATADRDWLKTVDHADVTRITPVELAPADRVGQLSAVNNAAKPIARLDELDRSHVFDLHLAGTLSLVVCNTVSRARDLYRSFGDAGAAVGKRDTKARQKGEPAPSVLLIHSRFRPIDRKESVRKLLLADGVLRGQKAEWSENDAAWIERVKGFGLIVVSTQVVEAGLDLSADTLITEIAPWPSLVQRFGRCNRAGTQNDVAKIRWVPLADKQAVPYEPGQLKEARSNLAQLSDASIASLEKFHPFRGQDPTHVIRQHDVHGLFSTEPDLAGGFTDISCYLRDAERETSVFVFWREKPSEHEAAPHRDEICTVPAWEMSDFLKLHKVRAVEWNGETEKWEPRRANEVRPGMTLLLDRRDGGYSDELGWTGDPDDQPTVSAITAGDEDAVARDERSSKEWYQLTNHLRDTEAEAKILVKATSLAKRPEGDAVVLAALWHDLGKSHPAWVAALPERGRPGPGPWAKFKLNYGEAFRPGIRHEAASALYCFDRWQARVEGWTALAVYLVAAHHGKVRSILRSRKKAGADVFGVDDGDRLPAVDGWLDQDSTLSLACRGFGASGAWGQDDESFRLLSPSWVGMIAELLGPETKSDAAPVDAIPESEPRHLGPFRLAFLEALMVAADIRASRRPGAGGAQ